MGINGFNNAAANILAKQTMANNAATQAASEQSTQNLGTKEGTEGIEAGAQAVGEDASTTVTEGAVHGSSEQGEGSGQGGQGGQNQEQGKQNPQSQAGVQHTPNGLPPIGVRSAGVQASANVQSANTLVNADATSTDIAGVQTQSTTTTPRAITLDFSRPNIEMPEKTFTTAELMMEMIRLGTEAFEQGVKSQSEGIKTRTQNRLANLQVQAKEMQEYYNKVIQSQKSPILAFFEGIGKLMNGDIEGATASFNTAWENGKALLLTVAVGIIGLAITVATGGGAAAIMVGVLALAIGTFFTDPGLMKAMVSSMGVDTDSKLGQDLVKGICISANIVSIVLSLGTNPSGLTKGITVGVGKLATHFAKKATTKGLTSAMKSTVSATKSTFSNTISKAQAKIAENAAKHAKAQQIGNAIGTTTQIAGGAASTGIQIERGIRATEGMEAKARANSIQIMLDSQNVDEDKNNQITQMLMEQYREMIATFVAIMSSLNAATVNAARA